MSARAIRMDTILQPIAISILAFAIGFQARAHIAPSFATAAGGAATRQPESTKRPKSDIVDLTDGPKADASTSPNDKPGSKGKVKGKKASTSQQSTSSSSGQSEDESDAEVDTDSEAEDLALALSSNPQSLKPTAFDEVKLVLVVNDSLHMTKGKIAAQAGHATLSCALMMKDVNPRMYKHWERHGQPKIALKCKDTEELEVLAAQARSLNLCARTIQDAGRTQVAPGSKTILGIGPGPARLINQVTGKLKLL